MKVLGGFLGILEEPTPGTCPGTGRTVTIREMPLGKSQSSLPRSILERHLAKVDTRTSVSFHSSSIGFRAFRAEATLHQAGRKHRWDMPENVACPEDLQAVHYVALVVLHYLTTSSDAATPFLKTTKSAPGQANADLGNRNMWDSLKDVLQVKLDQDLGKVTAKKANPKEPSDKTPSRPSEPSRQISPEFLHGLIAERHSRLEYQTMLRQRLTLPIAQERDNILRHLEDHQVLVVCGATGSGKSTQLPTYILENELTGGRHCHVICTEPRRISAVSLAKRCSVELGESHDAVGTSASLNWIFNSSRKQDIIEYTPRVHDQRLDEVTHLIIDEVHERSVEVDFLLLTLRTMLKTRPNLKVILMSATADADRISQYFEDAVQETGWTIDENSPFARRDGKVSQELIDFDEASVSEISGEVRLEKKYSPQTVSTLKLLDDRLIPFELVVKLMETLCLGKTPKHASVLIFLPGLREILSLADALESHPMFSSHIFKIFLLHSALSNDTQNTVFDTLPEGMVKIVLATNIAETGITISDITCVIDTCRHREMRYQRQTNRLLEMFISKANALQRRGRAGRVRPGECYHLCTKERFNKMAEHPVPEILRVNLTDVALRIKSLSIDLGANSIADALSQALEPPPLASIQKAVATLLEVGALTTTEDLTSLGRRLAQIPADIHLSKLFIAASLLRCLDPALTVGAVLASKSPFVAPLGQEKQADAAKASFKRGESDFLTFHNAFASWRRACANGVSKQFCRANYLNEQTLTQLEELRQQYLVDAGVLHVEKSSLQEFKRAQAMRGRRGNRVHFFNLPSTLSEYSDTDLIVDAALTMGLYPRLLKLEGNTMRTITNNQTVQFHPSSVHPRWMTDVAWNYFTYFTLTQSQNKRVYAAESGPGNDLALILLCGDPEFKLVSGAALSGKIRFKASPKVMVALKILRDRLDASLSAALRNAANLTTRHEKWLDITCRVLGNIRRNLDVEKETIAIR
ncbi:P-loop containing nucleoside triphosphate hydrolase protein [Flagelloscypha sp. PMI_526]|nr:P-loop containing nucleoside triphosphate hydrolase protein [Flagelloscypha sp. PMI_526]